MHARLFNRAKSKLHSVVSTIQETCSQTATFVKTIYETEPISSEDLVQSWEGGSRISDPANVTFLCRSSDTRQLLKKNFQKNLLFAAPILTYEIFKYYFCDSLYNPQEQADEAWSAYLVYRSAYLTNLGLSAWFFGPAYVKLIFSSMFTNMNVGNVVAKEHPHKHSHHCGCPDPEILIANIKSPVMYFIDTQVLWFLSFVLPLGKYFTYLPQAYIDGRALTEYLYSNQCFLHRQKPLAENSPYILGQGLVFRVLLDLLYLAIGIQNKMIYDALSFILFPAFIMISLLRDKPLPGKAANDPLYYFHMILNTFLDILSKLILGELKQPSSKCDLIVIRAPKKIDEVTKASDEIKIIRNHILLCLEKMSLCEDRAYVVSGEYLFYINQKKLTCNPVKLKKIDELFRLEEALKIKFYLNQDENAKCLIRHLNDEQLLKITEITGHTGYFSWEKLYGHLSGYPPIRLIIQRIVSNTYQSFDQVVKEPAIKKFLDLNASIIRDKLSEIQCMRETTWWPPYHLIKSTLECYTPKGYMGTKMLLQIILFDKFEIVLKNINDLLLAYQKQYQINVDQTKLEKERAKQVMVLHDQSAFDENKIHEQSTKLIVENYFSGETSPHSDSAEWEIVPQAPKKHRGPVASATRFFKNNILPSLTQPVKKEKTTLRVRKQYQHE